MKIIMLGAPGAGKGSQASRIAKEYQLPHISTGDIFRANLKEETELGKRAKSFMDKGELVPDDITIAMLLDRIHKEDCKNGYILDGFPRTIPQAEALKEALAKKDEKIDLALDVEASDELIIKRMAGRRTCPACGAIYHIVTLPPKTEGICDRCGADLIQRKDDNEETVKNRLKIYHEVTEPLISYYKKEGILEEIDGAEELDKVFEKVKRIIHERSRID
jgi:adenylate kinases